MTAGRAIDDVNKSLCIIWDKYTCLRYNYTLRPFFDSTARQRWSQFKNWGMWNRIGWVVFLDYLMGTWHLLWKVGSGGIEKSIHANEPSEYNGMLYRSSNRVLNNGIKVIILICMDGTSQYHHYRKVKAGYVQCRRTSPLRGSLLAASAARFGPSALKVRSFWMD